MKKIAIAFGLVVATAIGASAQISTETVTATAVGKDQVPASVLSAYEHDFPQGKKITDWTLLPSQVYTDKYAISTDGDDTTGVTDLTYSVNLYGKGTKALAVYNQNGKLLLLDEKITDTALPRVVVNQLMAAYPGIRITGDHAKIQQKGGKKKIRYQVQFVQNGKRGSAWLDENGNLLKARE